MTVVQHIHSVLAEVNIYGQNGGGLPPADSDRYILADVDVTDLLRDLRRDGLVKQSALGSTSLVLTTTGEYLLGCLDVCMPKP